MVLGFPCDQFLKQEFDSNEEIQNFCQLNYGVTFPVFAKIKVKGKNAHDGHLSAAWAGDVENWKKNEASFPLKA